MKTTTVHGSVAPRVAPKKANKGLPFEEQNLGKTKKNNKYRFCSEFSFNFEVDGLKQSYFKVDGLVLRSIKVFITWQTASNEENALTNTDNLKGNHTEIRKINEKHGKCGIIMKINKKHSRQR